MRPLTRATTIGLVAVVAVAALLVVGFVRPRLGGHDDVVYVKFRDAASLARFDRDVRVGGANVGTVGEVRREGSAAIVQLRFPRNAIGPIHRDATAELRPHLVFDGTAYIAFSPGSKNAPLLGDRPLGLERTHDFVSLDRALRFADAPTRKALQGALRDLNASLGRNEVASLRRMFSAQPRLYRSLTPAMRALQGPDRNELTGAIRGYAQTVDGLARQSESFAPLLRSTARTISAFRADGDRPLDATLRALPPALSSSATGSAELERIVDRLAPLAVDLTPAMREFAPTLAALRPVFKQARPVLEQTPAFARDLRVALQAGGQAAAPTRHMLELLDPTLDILRDELLPFLRSRTLPGDPTIYEKMVGAAASAGASMSGVRSPAAAKALNVAPGHGWHFYAGAGNSGRPTCDTIAEPIRKIVRDSEQCIG